MTAAADLLRSRTDPTPRPRDRAAQPAPVNLVNLVDLVDPVDPVDPVDLAGPDLIKTVDPSTLLKPAEVATMFRVDPKTVTRWARNGQLTAVRTLGGHRRYRHGNVSRLLNQR